MTSSGVSSGPFECRLTTREAGQSRPDAAQALDPEPRHDSFKKA
jgi:hypothetical protein